MEANLLDFRRRMGDILRSIDRNEPVKVLCRGRERAVLVPLSSFSMQDKRTSSKPQRPMTAHRSFGMWKDHRGVQDADVFVRALRRSRFLAAP